METKKRYVFKCPNCGHDKVSAVRENTTVVSAVLAVKKDEIELEAYPKFDDEHIDKSYRCASCGEVIAHDDDELKMKLEQEYYAADRSFVDGLIRLFPDTKMEEDTIQKNIIQYLKNKGIEIEKNE